MDAYIEREIHFFRVDAGLDTSRRPLPFDPRPSLVHINKLKFVNNNLQKSRYWHDEDKVIACWVESLDNPVKISLGTIRRNDLPQMELQGELTSLEIPEYSGLVEQTHVVFFDNNIVGCDFNFYGPRISRLAYYLAEKAVGIAPETIHFNQILRQDIFEKLRKFSILKSFDIKVRSSYANVIRDADENLGAALDSAYKAGDADEIEIVLKASRRSKGWLNENLLSTIDKLLRKRETRYETSKFEIRGYTNESSSLKVLNLLSDDLIVKKSILKKDRRSGALNSKAAYDAIMEAHNEVKDEISLLPDLVI
jgi:hypothetical protein